MREQEKQRPPNGLVKVVCLPSDGAAAQKHGWRKDTDARFETMIGPSSRVDSYLFGSLLHRCLLLSMLHVKNYMHIQSVNDLGAVAFTDRWQFELPEALEISYKIKRWQADQRGCCPVLQALALLNAHSQEKRRRTVPQGCGLHLIVVDLHRRRRLADRVRRLFVKTT